jgi:hypothetical protein
LPLPQLIYVCSALYLSAVMYLSEWEMALTEGSGDDSWSCATDFPCASANAFKWHPKVFRSACVRRRCWQLPGLTQARVLVEFRNAFPKPAIPSAWRAWAQGWGGITAGTDLRAHKLEGITADESGAVTRINLSHKGLEGKHIPGRHQ